MRIPWGDWQFWIVTAAAIVALAWLMRAVLPIPFFSARQRQKRRERRVNLTVGGKSVR